MLKDFLLTWKGPFPYDLVAQFGITPSSSRSEVLAALQQMLSQRGTQERQQAEPLFQVETRLLLDFFLYHLPADELAALAARQSEP